MLSLENAYDAIAAILGSNIETYSAVELVERYRHFWKPADVKVILLAESHVFTSVSDMSFRLKTLPELGGYPDSYAKFVYCLAYGEESLTEGNQHPARDGTPQFWKIFYSCLNKVESNTDFFPVLKSKNPTTKRIRAKIDILKEMRSHGIWLVDACITALYNDGNKPPFNVMKDAIRASWNGYTRNVISEASPEHVIIIGKGVASVVGHEVRNLMKDNYTVIPQPNAHLSAQEHLTNFQRYFSICSEHCKE